MCVIGVYCVIQNTHQMSQLHPEGMTDQVVLLDLAREAIKQGFVAPDKSELTYQEYRLSQYKMNVRTVTHSEGAEGAQKIKENLPEHSVDFGTILSHWL